MKNKLSSNQSSYLVAWPVIGLLFVLGILAAVKGWFFPGAILLMIAILALAARIWAIFSCRDLEITIKNDSHGMFPGDKMHSKLKISNNKFLPVLWMELDCPMEEDPPIVCSEGSVRDITQVLSKDTGKVLKSKMAEIKLPSFLWYETNEKTITWTAAHRGVWTSDRWGLVSGDGLGLSQIEKPVGRLSGEYFAVYPAIQAVDESIFIKNIYNGETGSKGLSDDLTVIRSSRTYQPGDNARYINWRLAARNLPVQVNIYEQILPGNIHLIIDGESFSSPVCRTGNSAGSPAYDETSASPQPHKEELEDMLSVIASELIVLDSRSVKCGLSICSGEGKGATHLFSGEADLEDMLYALAAYKPLESQMEDDNKTLKAQNPDFDMDTYLARISSIGHTYFVTYNKGSALSRNVLELLDPDKTSVITYEECAGLGEFEVLYLASLKGGREK